ncbi:MAG: hypothetical protein AAFY20_20860 [Cyanobacteria bacterium J06639_14]
MGRTKSVSSWSESLFVAMNQYLVHGITGPEDTGQWSLQIDGVA